MSSQTLNYFEPQLKRAVDQIVAGLRHTYHVSKQSIALLFLQKDAEIEALIQKNDSASFDKLKALRQSITEKEPEHECTWMGCQYSQNQAKLCRAGDGQR